MKKCNYVSITEAISHVKSNDKIVLGHGAVSPILLLEELYRQRERLFGVKIFHLIYLGDPVHTRPDAQAHFQTRAPFITGGAMRDAVADNRAEFVPMHFHIIPYHFLPGGGYEPDWAFIQVTPPDANGRCSLSLASDYTLPAARAAKRVIAMVNPNLPYVYGDNFLSVDEIDFMVEAPMENLTIASSPITETDQKIAEYCTSLIGDGACIQVGIGSVPEAVLSKLHDRKDLGIHTELMTDAIMNLIKSGAVNGSKKGVLPNKVLTAFAMGSQEMYDFMHNNDDILLYPVDFTNNPFEVGKNENFVSINSTIEVDLYGQLCSEKVNGRQYSGTGGQVDFLRGARYSRGGKSIITVHSTAKNGTISRIVPSLSAGNNVTSGRTDVDYIVTEHGIAHLFGKSERERALALCAIADPRFREELEKEAYTRFNIKKIF
ncbi:acetyl-CoA hydrolase/transferase family protein [Porphyromonas sp. COT-108 OH1349]|uniref:acetyl-CoA hydrolase/transferase family protein n=1 Tax=Porphyromonas sp. COT-108 OH1349 TaxID=1537504 RepID=UPI00052C0948|nr:acetyl-CoA hydrolase/transferase C-terminal domain-containing protein [Porphyromonas sp. COT-108 OH1349]KGN67452.1 hypothetical protein JT26_09510 [Porphyromonas sp. COT-108 OH1349]